MMISPEVVPLAVLSCSTAVGCWLMCKLLCCSGDRGRLGPDAESLYHSCSEEGSRKDEIIELRPMPVGRKLEEKEETGSASEVLRPSKSACSFSSMSTSSEAAAATTILVEAVVEPGPRDDG